MNPNEIQFNHGHKSYSLRLGLGAVMLGLIFLNGIALAVYIIFGS